MKPPHYVYRVDHDLGFAPHVSKGVCTVCGCKTTTIERWARQGSWIVGIGGVGTGRRDTLIYAMQVEEIPPHFVFKRANPRRAAYLSEAQVAADAPVLVSRTYYYFGNKSPAIPQALQHIIHPTQGCKRLSDDDIALLQRLVLNRHGVGKHGEPNNNEFVDAARCKPDCPPREANKRLQQIARKTRSC
jgi:hypothetical protein